MNRLSGSRYLAERLSLQGVSHVFVMPVIVPGTLKELESLGVQRVLVRSEKAAAYMADGYARIAQSTGVCMAQSVGAANLAAGLQDPWLGCSPVLAITGSQSTALRQRHAYQEIDHKPLFSAVTKYSARVNDASQLPRFLDQALRETLSGTPGPAHLDLEGFVGQSISQTEVESDLEAAAGKKRIPAKRPGAEPADIERALRLLGEAKRPLLIAGGGVRSSRASGVLRTLAEKLSVPVATSLNARDCFPSDHPLAIGVCGQYSRECANRAVAEADLVFFIGSRTGGQVTNDWKLVTPGTDVMQLDISAEELGRNYQLALGMQADVQTALAQMLEHAQAVDRPEWTRWIADRVQDWKSSVQAFQESDEQPIRPERLCRELSQHLPVDSILVSDTGHAGIWTGTMIDLKGPRQSYIRCAGSLGWGIPAAIGAQCAAPDRPVVCFTGDGGAWYHLSEWETASRYGIPAIFVINNNASLNQEKKVNERVYGGRTMGSDALWRMPDRDFAAIARAMGCRGETVHDPSCIEPALASALESGQPTVIDVKTTVDGIAPPAWSPVQR